MKELYKNIIYAVIFCGLLLTSLWLATNEIQKEKGSQEIAENII